MPLVTIPLRLFGKSLKEYNFSVFTLPATFKPVEEFGMFTSIRMKLLLDQFIVVKIPIFLKG